jgi:hypothetical protein
MCKCGRDLCVDSTNSPFTSLTHWIGRTFTPLILSCWIKSRTYIVIHKERALESQLVVLPPAARRGTMSVLRRSTFDPLSLSAFALRERTASQSQLRGHELFVLIRDHEKISVEMSKSLPGFTRGLCVLNAAFLLLALSRY